jgi:hypothetical protein
MSLIVSQMRIKSPHTLSKIILQINIANRSYEIPNLKIQEQNKIIYSDWQVKREANAIARSFFFSNAKTLDILSIHRVINLSSTNSGVCFSLRATSAIT